MEKDKLLGELLLESNLISKNVLNRALETQKSTAQPLGSVLLGMNALTQDDLEKALAKKFGFTYLNPNTYRPPDSTIRGLIPLDFAKKYCCFPYDFDKQNKLLTVVIVDPIDTEPLQKLSELTHMNIRLTASREIWIRQMIDKFYA